MFKRKTHCHVVWNYAVASQPSPPGHITADKRKIKSFPKLPSANSLIRKTLSEIQLE